ncbi:histone-lysine N-methyltransferase EHMT2 isoform X1 [Trichogramma pretiosum]|uniref:histone-lysine N-methyltransferase EHMT2 isoform X1 n=1 Tax=Trichogramma pretiosum TaxID=7493 RepID=UPI0006C95106|nr:histone-lysine N-methyltransferase EHMT2 isoform X1 [Trichogramma pretiosum]XP_014223484.1 histone-lysine N-methyltransferase EHMT2 isoform X1 [Trichogramma pretiosum]XP_014223485.1 histone-lysine N-methyltransferase EHMT2 isoform X1 [Trichogramma pretiosum]XP_014223487.1 histone-lysine N-methyltransferase EHMT2 isoform X1 [Trichogramma pretiosum]
MSESKRKDSVSKVSQKQNAEDDLNLAQILEGMTNEFNKSGPKKPAESPTRRSSRIEPGARKQEKSPSKSPSKSLEENNKTNRFNKSLNQTEETKVIKENIPEKKVEKNKSEEMGTKSDTAVKKDSPKKDGNAHRIVLTFRTIDENTDHGKKTKISSTSNLSLVPDELNNCDQIGGVSVKIENSDEHSSDDNKSEVNREQDDKNKVENGGKSDSEAVKSSPESKAENRALNAVIDESSKESESMTPPPVKRRMKRQRDSSIEPELKRSARRSNSSKSVLESAMAMKEKFNLSEDTVKRKYSKPGRPKKIVAENLDKKNNMPPLTPIETSKISVKKGTPPKDIPKSVEPKKDLPKNSPKDNVSKVLTKKAIGLKLVKRPSSELTENNKEPSKIASKDSSPKSTIIKSFSFGELVKGKSPPEKKDNIPKLKPIETIKAIPMEISEQLPEVKNDKITNKVEKTTAKVIPEAKESLLKSAYDKKDEIPKLKPLAPKISLDKKNSLPKLCPLNTVRTIIPVSNFMHCKSDSQKLNKYEGMPKLTPIVKTQDSGKKFAFTTSEKTVHAVSLLKNFNGSFSRPTIIRSKNGQIRIRPSASAKKMVYTNILDENAKQAVETNKVEQDDEGSTIPIKKPRRSLILTPAIAESFASTTDSTSVTKTKMLKSKLDLKCLCEVRSQLFVTITTADTPLHCTALDSIDNRIVGCGNEVDREDVAMRRPSAKIPYIILCRTHKERLIRHNCCPTCGQFCSQGKFVHCPYGHQYHRHCELILDNKSHCPHCENDDRCVDVIITMGSKLQNLTNSCKLKDGRAKMIIPGKADNTKLAEMPVKKKSIEPLIDPKLIQIPESEVSEKTERFTHLCLLNAVKENDLQKLVNVLANGFNPNHVFRDQGHRTALHMAAESGSLSSVHVLVQAGAQVDVFDRNQSTPLMLAAVSGNADVVRYLIRTGSDSTLRGEDGMTALHMAAKSGHLEVCKVIHSECKVPRSLVDSVDDGGWTGLIWACEFRHTEVARFLLECKCDPLIRDNEQNIALHWSAYSGCSEITELLLDLGSDVNAVNVHGDTPLHIAARQDRYAVSVLLLSRGAKVNEVNNNKETAIDCCTVDGDTLRALRLNFRVNQRAEQLMEKTVKILTNDITRGKERNPIQCVNGIDYEDIPTDFVYVTENCFTSSVNVDRTITSLQSCRCENNCSSETCLCGTISLRCWYDEQGKLIPEFNFADPPMLFECNQACDCNRILCHNRVVQHGTSQRFQLFRTEEGKGWGLRTLKPIAKGTYVCEYVGEIIPDSEADSREDDSYLFDLENRDGETYCIDARRYGNIARFINHSCSPNLLSVRVFIEHQDLRFPRIALFASRDIEADEELGFDYGEKFWIIKCKSFTCTCGSDNCRYSDKTIQSTLDNYRQRVQRQGTVQKPNSSEPSL